MSEPSTPSDSEVVASFHGGDSTAFGVLYDRYADAVNTYAWIVLGDASAASEVTRDTFIAAGQALAAGQTPDDFRVWLLGRGRAEIRALGRGGGVEPTSDEADVGTSMLRQVSGFGERDREILALNLVGGLEPAQLASVMGVDEEHIDALVEPSRARLARALGPTLVAVFGSERCEELTGMVRGLDPLATPTRTTVSPHVGRCLICQGRRDDLMTPAVLSGVFTRFAPEGLREEVLATVEAPVVVEAPQPTPIETPAPAPDPIPTVVVPPPLPPPPPLEDPAPEEAVFGAPPRDGLGDMAKVAIFAVVTVIVGLIGLAVSARFQPLETPRRQPVVASASATTTTTVFGSSTTVTQTSGPSSTTPASPAEFQVSVATIDFGDESTAAEFAITNSGGLPAAFTVASSSDFVVLSAGGEELGPGESVTYQVALNRETMTEGELAGNITVAWPGGEVTIAVTGVQQDNPILHSPQASPAQISVSGGSCSNTQSTISVRVTDRSPIDRVVARWSPDGSARSESEMISVGNDRFEGVVGPFTAPQTSGVRIVAFDEAGNAGGATAALTVVACS